MDNPIEGRKVMTIEEFKKQQKKIDKTEQLLLRKSFNCEVKQSKENDRALDFIISTGSIDRSEDTLNPKGWEFKNYKKNPVVLWAHDYKSPSIAKALDVKVEGNNVISTAEFLPHNLADHDWVKFSDMIYQMYLNGFLNATSVGFDPFEWKDAADREWGIDFIKQELLEYSCVPVPANAEALLLAGKKGIDLKPLKMWAEKTLEDYHGEEGLWIPREKIEGIAVELNNKKIFDINKDKKDKNIGKGATTFQDLATADKEREWDASAADNRVREWAGGPDKDDIDWSKYRQAFFWYDSEDSENFGGYKLPFADVIDGSLKAVWRGVAAAMAALNGARGGVDIPEDDRKTVYNHIGKYYNKFDEEQPDLKSLKDIDEERSKEIVPVFDKKETDENGNLIGKCECPHCGGDLFVRMTPELAKDIALTFINHVGIDESKSLKFIELEVNKVLNEKLEEVLEQINQLKSGDNPGGDKQPDDDDETVLELIDEDGDEEEDEISIDIDEIESIIGEVLQERLNKATGKIDQT